MHSVHLHGWSPSMRQNITKSWKKLPKRSTNTSKRLQKNAHYNNKTNILDGRIPLAPQECMRTKNYFVPSVACILYICMVEARQWDNLTPKQMNKCENSSNTSGIVELHLLLIQFWKTLVYFFVRFGDQIKKFILTSHMLF